MKGIEGRTALVTGAAGDIGRAVARQLGNHGANLILADHPAAREGLDRNGNECAQSGSSVETVAFDVAQPDEVIGALSQFPTATLIFNNAGVQGSFQPVQDYPVETARQLLEVNVLGALNVLSVSAKSMIGGGLSGSVVNTASMAGVSGAPNMPAYSASKAAVIGLTLSAAKDLAPYGIRVNAISPAFIGPGKMWTGQVEAQARAGSQYYSNDATEVAAQMMSQVPMRRYGSTEEVAACAVFLLSEEASYLTGVNLEIAGGAR